MPEEEKIENFKEEKTLFEWIAAERPFKKRDRDFWITAVAILVLFSVILFFVKEFFLIVALGSAVFMAYAMATVPPGEVRCKLTNMGVYFGDSRHEWLELRRFWFKKSLDSELLIIETKIAFPRQIQMVIQEKDKEKIKEMVTTKIPMLEESPTFVDKLTKWFSARLPLENRK